MSNTLRCKCRSATFWVDATSTHMTTRRINEQRYIHGRGVSNHLDICVIKSNLGSSMDTLVSCDRRWLIKRAVQRTVLRDARGSVRLSPSFCGGGSLWLPRTKGTSWTTSRPLPQIRHVKTCSFTSSIGATTTTEAMFPHFHVIHQCRIQDHQTVLLPHWDPLSMRHYTVRTTATNSHSFVEKTSEGLSRDGRNLTFHDKFASEDELRSPPPTTIQRITSSTSERQSFSHWKG